jgi:hypothetical protein
VDFQLFVLGAPLKSGSFKSCVGWMELTARPGTPTLKVLDADPAAVQGFILQ